MSSPTDVGGRRYPAGFDRPVPSLARYVLEVIEQTYQEHAPDGHPGLPNARTVTVGSVAVDSELIAVMFGGVAVGPPGNEMNQPYRGDSQRTATFNIELWRYTPTLSPSGNAPSTVDISAAAEVIMHDSWLLLEAAYSTDQLGVGVIANVAVNEPQGELQGVSMSLELAIP